jgi:C4-dicarboxylate-specific signal transduction histidine kinase
MAKSTKMALASYALSRFLLVLIQLVPHVASITIHRARSEEESKRSDAFLAKVQRVSATGSFFWRAATGEIEASEQVYHIFVLNPSLPLTLELMATRVHPDDLPLVHERLEQARSAVSDLDFEHRLQIPDGSVKYLHVMAHGIRDQAGQLEYIGAVQDVTNRRLSEEALGQTRAALTHMARLTTLEVLAPSIAHEISQPLSGVITNANTCLRMLATDRPSLDSAREAARRALRDAERACDLIKRLRMLVAKKETTSDQLDLNDAIREAVALASSELQRRRVVLRADLAGDLPRVRGDRVQLQQVVLNLLVNSSEAMSGVEDRPRHLLIRTKRHDGAQVCVTVRDAGMGFHPKDAERLFEAFYTTKSKGMGIGLFISRTIVERHRGRLWAKPNEGHGATFSFSIPHDQQISWPKCG